MISHEVVRLNKLLYDVKAFDCGTSSITQYLRRYAAKNMGLNLSSTFVLPFDEPGVKPPAKKKIAGFYTLANLTVAASDIPLDKTLPRYPVPVILLAQLGIDRSVQRRGLGSKLLIAALRHAYSICTNENGIPASGVVLDAVDQNALAYYQSFDFFLPFPGNTQRLFIPLKALAEL